MKQIHIDYARNAKRLDVKRLKTKMWEVITQNEEDMKENMVGDSACTCALYHTLYFLGGKHQYIHHIYKETYSTRSRILCFVLKPSFKTLYPDDKKPFYSYLLCLLATPCQ